MEKMNLFSEIGRILAPQDARLVLPALRHSPLAWKSLEQVEFLQSAIQQAGSAPRRWSPGALALPLVGDIKPEMLAVDPPAVLEHGLQEKAVRLYQSTQRSGDAPTNLRDACLLALALRERRRMIGNWSGLLQEILPKPLQADAWFPVWRAPLACLYSYIPDPEEMLRALLPKNNLRIAFEWIVLTQLSQPLADEEHVRVFTRLIQNVPVTLQLNLLRSLNLHGYEAVAAQVADNLLVGHPAFASVRAPSSQGEVDLSHFSSRALALQQMATFYQISGERKQALSLFDAVEHVLEQWLSALALQRMNAQNDEIEADAVALEDWAGDHLGTAAGWLKDELGAVLLSHARPGSFLDEVPGGESSPLLQLKQASWMVEQEPAVARDMARQSAAELLARIRQHALPFHAEFVYSWRPQDAIEILLQIGLPHDALELTLALLEVRPTDRGLLRLAEKASLQTRNLRQAILAAQSGAALEPENPYWQRSLGNLWQQVGEHERAFQAWKQALGMVNQPETPDQLHCAQAALNAGHLYEAIAMSENLLQNDPGNGAAMGLLGRVMIKQGQLPKAVDYLVQSTLLNPELLDSWLALAAAHRELGDEQRSLDTLHAAVTALPDRAETHLALGTASLANGMLSDALANLKKAFFLAPELEGSALAYSDALVRMGHITEARAVLERVRGQWTTHPELAYSYARVLLEQNNPEAALPVLQSAIGNGLSDLQAHLLYVRIMLGEYSSVEGTPEAVKSRGRMAQAELALGRILEIEPANLEARLLIADIHREREELELALAQYQALVDIAGASSTTLRYKMQWGLGRTALRLGKTEIGVAALQEACQARPDFLPLQRDLAEALLKARLSQEALNAADAALNLAPDMVENLTWYADFAAQVGEAQKAVDALARAVQIDQNRADLMVDLAHRQVNAGELDAARISLQKLGEIAPVSSEEYRRAAQIYLRLQEPAAALQYFERALEVEPAPADLLFEVAELQERMGNISAALELSQQALENNPKNLPVYLLQADLLSRLDRPQAALALLERALRLTENAPEFDKEVLADIHDNFARILVQENHLPEALAHAEKALAYKPGRVDLCYQAADLALALVQYELAERIVWGYMTENENRRSSLYTLGKDGLDLLCLQVEMALESGQAQAAQAGVEEGLASVSGNPRFQAAKVRLLAREGDLVAARRLYDFIREMLKKGRSGEYEIAPLWLADAALEAQQWKEALAMYEQIARSHPVSARAQLRLARALVMSAERQIQSEAVNCRVNAPGPAALDAETQRKFEEAIQMAERLAGTPENKRWLARGNAVFTPDVQSARALASLSQGPDDTAALMAILRRINNLSAATQLARRYSSEPAILMELVLCHLAEAPADGLETAEQLAARQPGNPLAQAALAVLAEKTGELNRSIEAYELALKMWDNEPVWHDAAADLCTQVGMVSKGLEHHHHAFALDPANAQYAYKLGKVYLAEENIPQAIEHLERATLLDQVLPGAWLDLATAYHIAKQYPQALDAARQAVILDPMSAECLMIAGDIALAMCDNDRALEYAENAIQCAPKSPYPYLFMSQVLNTLDRQTDATSLLEQAPPAVRESFPVAFEYARLLYCVQGAKSVLQMLEQLAQDNADQPGLLSFLARVQAECGEIQAAEQNAFKALRLDPNQPELTLMLGQLQHKTGQLDQAVSLLTEAMRMAPDVIETYLELGAVYQRRREYMQALQVYRQAMKVAPDDHQAYYQSGLILRDSKDYSSAEAMLRRAAELAPENLSIRRQLVGVIALNLVHSKQEVTLQ